MGERAVRVILKLGCLRQAGLKGLFFIKCLKNKQLLRFAQDGTRPRFLHLQKFATIPSLDGINTTPELRLADTAAGSRKPPECKR